MHVAIFSGKKKPQNIPHFHLQLKNEGMEQTCTKECTSSNFQCPSIGTCPICMFTIRLRLPVDPATIDASPWAYIDQYVSRVCGHISLLINARVEGQTVTHSVYPLH